MVPQNRKKKSLDQTKDLPTIGRAGNSLWKKWESIKKSGDRLALEELFFEIEFFTSRLSTRWMGKRFSRLLPENQMAIMGIHSVMTKTMIETKNVIANIDRGAMIKQEIGSLDFPVSANEMAHLSYPDWLRSPYNHSETLIEAIEELDIP